MRRVFVTSLAMMFATATPVLAAEYWLSQDPQTKYCEIVETVPDGKTKVMVGEGSYPTTAAAKAAKKAAKKSGECVPKPD